MNKEKLILIFSLMSIFFLSCLLSCAPQPIQMGSQDDAVLIQTKAQIRNDRETNTVKIEIALLPKKAIRFEITATLGVSVATVLLTPTQITYALHSTKQYAVGSFNAKTLYPIFKKNIDPRILWRAINDQPMTNLDLNCDVDTESRPTKCIGRDGTTIKWSYQEPPHKRIDIISNQFEMNWIFRSQSLLVESQNKTFVLDKPEDYQEITTK